MKLKKVIIHKYKSFESEQSFNIENDITILVGMNESGKTAILEAIAKSNYFKEDKDFKFNMTHDYPRREKKSIDKTGEIPKAVTCIYEIDDRTFNNIENELGKDIIKNRKFQITTKYDNSIVWEPLEIDTLKVIENLTKKENILDDELNNKLCKIKNSSELKDIINSYSSEEKYQKGLNNLYKYFENKWKWDNPIAEYISRIFLNPNIPKYLYYDEYYLLPSRITIESIAKDIKKDELEPEKIKTAKALFDLAELDPEKILKEDDFESFIAELEATQAIISEELFKYWKTNKNLDIEFRIDKRNEGNYNNNIKHILDIRVKNRKLRVSLPLRNRSKGFNWFFSFLVWFKKIQEDKGTNYILLLDEPGLNLHASAQADMLRFLEDLSKNYQIIYTTHSPFSIPTDKLHRVRTVLETDEGSIISDTLHEKDPKTLFPLQAALGYDLAQNLFISQKNLLVEGISDLIYLEAMSGILESIGKESLRKDITIVTTGGLDKVATFISLLRGNKLNTVCLLDTPKDPKGKAKLEDMIKNKLIKKQKIIYFNNFLPDYNHADIEDLFFKQDYLNIFNKAFEGIYKKLELSDLNDQIKPIIIQINKALKIDRFNHYRPANELLKQGLNASNFNEITLNNFESVIKEVNKLFK